MFFVNLEEPVFANNVEAGYIPIQTKEAYGLNSLFLTVQAFYQHAQFKIFSHFASQNILKETFNFYQIPLNFFQDRLTPDLLFPNLFLDN